MNNRVVIRTADEAAFFAAAREAARRADRGEPFEGTITLSFEDPRRMLEVLTKNRQALVREATKRLGRDPVRDKPRRSGRGS